MEGEGNYTLGLMIFSTRLVNCSKIMTLSPKKANVARTDKIPNCVNAALVLMTVVQVSAVTLISLLYTSNSFEIFLSDKCSYVCLCVE